MQPEPAPLPSPQSKPVKPQSKPPSVQYGESVQTDLRLKKLVAREQFLLLVIMPRFRTLADMRKEWVRRTCKSSVLIPCTIVITLHIGSIGLCVPVGSTICAGGPDLDRDQIEDGWASYAFKEYGPPIINALATLMLSFYANICMNLYTEGYFAARQLQEAIIDLTTMVAGTIPPHMHEVRLEFWRCVNLYHLCSFVLADKGRLTYNMENFLLPVASAYGEWNPAGGKFGMLHEKELELLSPSVSMVKRFQMKAKKPSTETVLGERKDKGVECAEGHKAAAPSYAIDQSKVGGPKSLGSLKRSVTQRLVGKRVDKEQMELRLHKKRTSGRLDVQDAGGYESAAHTLANSRGDVSSDAAVMHAALGVRLYQLVDLVIKEKLSCAAWPAWNAVCMKLRGNSERLKQRALFRLPRIYQASVRFLVASTILTDTFLIASHAARLLRNANSDEGWRYHAYLGALIDFVLNLLLTWCLAVFLDAITDMQTPFGGEPVSEAALDWGHEC